MMSMLADAPSPDDYLEAIRSEGTAPAHAAGIAASCRVPTCPDWTIDDLVTHVGLVHRRAALMVREHRTSEVPFSALPSPPANRDARLAWLVDASSDLARALADAGPQAPVWNWTAGEQIAMFWFRRMAHETAVHRWDAESVVGPARPVPAHLAADGVEEILDVFLPEAAAGLPPGGLGVLRLRCDDLARDWLIAAGPGGVTVSRATGEEQATVSGTASELMMFAWNRLAPSALVVHGDRRIPAAWRGLLRW